MFIVVYLIGPSQVGKTTIADLMAEAGEIVHVDLDRRLREVAGGRPLIEVAQDRAVVQPMLDELETNPSGLATLVSIGAGTQDMDRRHGDTWLMTWLMARSSRVILVDGDRDELYRRSKVHEGYRDRFIALEYGPARTAVYEAAGTKVSVSGLSKDDAALIMTKAVRSVISANRAHVSSGQPLTDITAKPGDVDSRGAR